VRDRSDVALQDPDAAAEIPVPLAGDEAEKAMKHPAAEGLEGRAGARPAHANRHVRGGARSHDLAEFGRDDLVVGGQGDHHAAPGLVEARGKRRSFPEIARQFDHAQPWPAGHEAPQFTHQRFVGAIEHDNEFEGDVGFAQAVGILVDQHRQIVPAGADRDDGADFRLRLGHRCSPASPVPVSPVPASPAPATPSLGRARRSFTVTAVSPEKRDMSMSPVE
jgi:hypothetical protein